MPKFLCIYQKKWFVEANYLIWRPNFSLPENQRKTEEKTKKLLKEKKNKKPLKWLGQKLTNIREKEKNRKQNKSLDLLYYTIELYLLQNN